jgi:hypothetical protein
MSTLQEALKKALEKDANEWDKDQQRIDKEKQMPKHLFKPTNNASRATFNFIKDNPNLTQKEVNFELGVRGFKESTIASLITQFIRSGTVQRVNGKLVATVNDYQPVKTQSKKKKVITVHLPKAEHTIQQHVEAKWDAQELLSTLSIVQAKQLYTALKEIFSN